MADTLDKRLADIEYLISHLPGDLDARFAGAESRMFGRFDQLNIRLQAVERRIQEAQQASAANGAKLDEILARLPPGGKQ